MNDMKHYKAIIYCSGIEHEMIINAVSKKQAIITLANIYERDLEKLKVIIKVRDLTYEEMEIYKVLPNIKINEKGDILWNII